MKGVQRPPAGIVDVYDLLYRLGLSANYTGFFYTSYAIWLAADCPDRLIFVTKWLYPAVAKQYHTTWGAVERGIRSSINTIWRTDPHAIQEITNFPLPDKPTPARFIAILSTWYAAHRAA